MLACGKSHEIRALKASRTRDGISHLEFMRIRNRGIQKVLDTKGVKGREKRVIVQAFRES